MKRKRGRPPVEDPKLHLPNLVVKRSLLDQMEEIAERENITQSTLLAKALHTYFKAYYFPNLKL